MSGKKWSRVASIGKDGLEHVWVKDVSEPPSLDYITEDELRAVVKYLLHFMENDCTSRKNQVDANVRAMLRDVKLSK